MKLRIPIISTVVAMVSGIIALFLRLLPTGLEGLYTQLLQVAAVLAGAALLVGIINLIKVHYNKILGGGASSGYSVVLVLSLSLTFLAALVLGPTGRIGTFEPTNWAFQYIQLPVEVSLVAVLAVSLIYSGARLLRRSPTTFSFVFLATALLVLLGSSLLGTGDFGFLSDGVSSIRTWILTVPASGGARGLLLGVALGAVGAGLRILMGTDRPYGGS